MNAIKDATRAQTRAADPNASTWVSANAGSGKTRVLTDRVARLLLHGCDPQRIVCLTYTNAAAGEMQNRLFKRLGEWAMMPTPDLRAALTKLGEEPDFLTDDKLREARTLFAAALETPGGLKIQTIHAFCDALLRRFPLEAGVSPGFAQIDDRQDKMLQSEVLQDIAEGSDSDALARFARIFSGFDVNGLITEIAGHKDAFGETLGPQEFGLIEGQTVEALCQKVFDSGARRMVEFLLPSLEASGTNDARAAVKLRAALEATDPFATLRELESALLTGSGAKTPFEPKIGSFPTKAVREKHADIMDFLNALMQAVADARIIRTRLLAYQNGRILHDFSAAFLHRYDTRKAQRGLLTFDDLIDRALALLASSGSAQWVLYKLDGGIDHLLVDEAQDTSPKQWKLIERLVAEFTAGKGARDMARTVFAVGDEKQSIYSFQGADPREFARMRDHFRAEFDQVGRPFAERDLTHSFRSADPILRLVDNIFTADPAARFEGGCSHAASDTDKPGRIDLWPLIEDQRAEDDTPWYQPVNRGQTDDPANRLASNIAEWIREAVNGGHPVYENGKPGEPGRWRPARWGDFLILVRGRGQNSKVSLFQSIIKQLKARNVPIAGQDRLDIAADLAVQDVISVLKFAVTDRDDLSLAEALRSPLIGLREADLFSLSYDRNGSLWNRLLSRRAEFPAAHALLSDLLQRADFDRPFELIQRILIQHNGRRRLLARLGHEAEEAIDQLLSEVLKYETLEAPTLTGFLDWFETGDITVKRQLEGGQDLVRIMTVHGAKGLEAPIVILPDTLDKQRNDRSKLFTLPSGSAAWKSGGNDVSDAEEAAKRAKQAAEDAEALRLLYVALTRAESQLVVCGAGKPPKQASAWYNLVSAGMERSGATDCNFGEIGLGKTLFNDSWKERVSPDEADKTATASALPDWATTPATTPGRPARPVSPSGLEGAKVLPGEEGLDADAAKLRGTRIHALLEHLPGRNPADWPALADRVLRAGPVPATAAEIAECLAEAQKVLSAPELAELFGPCALAEVGVTATLGELGGEVIDGVIDRLLIGPDKIVAVDFKTNAVVPSSAAEVPVGLLRQMGAYLLALQQIYPDLRIEIAILWTRTATLMPLPHNLVIGACKSATLP